MAQNDKDISPVIFDGHNDFLSKYFQDSSADLSECFAKGEPQQLNLAKAKLGGFSGGFFAVFIASEMNMDTNFGKMQKPTYQLPLPTQISWKSALPSAVEQIGALIKLQNSGVLRICTSTDDIRFCFEEKIIAAVLHLEGAEAIDRDFYALELFYAAGLRSLGPVWSRPTIWGEGVPFAFPATPDFGDGLTEDGLRLLQACNEKRILFDVSHLNEAGFWDVVRHSSAPIVATHSNVHAICPHTRNLTDKQLQAIAQSDGMVGLNFATALLRADGQMINNTSVDDLLRHLDYMLEMLGEDGVGFGSDFDGAIIPKQIQDVAGLVNLRSAMRKHGYGEELLEKLCHKNWLRVLKQTWET